MATCRDIVTRALHLSGIVPLNRDPKAAEGDMGLVALQSLFDDWFARGMFGTLTEVYKDTDYTAQEGERITADGATITLPDTYTINGVTRAPRDLSPVVVLSNGQTNYIYSGGAWETCSGLTLNSDAPLASRGELGLSAIVAERIVEMFGGELTQGVYRLASEFRTSLSFKLGTEQPPRESVYY